MQYYFAIIIFLGQGPVDRSLVPLSEKYTGGYYNFLVANDTPTNHVSKDD